MIKLHTALPEFDCLLCDIPLKYTRWPSARFSCLSYTDRNTSPKVIGEILASFLQDKITSLLFWFLHYTDKITSLLIIGEIWVSLLYRQNYLTEDHRWDFSCFLLYTHRITSPKISGEILVRYIQLFRERLSNKTVRGNAERYYV